MTFTLEAFAPRDDGGAGACLMLDHVAVHLGVSVRSVQRLIASGRLRKLPLDRLVRIAPAELLRFLEGRPHAAPSEADTSNIK